MEKTTKIKSYNHFYRLGDLYEVIFYIPFDGYADLLYLRPSSLYLTRFTVKNIISSTNDDYGKIVFSLEFNVKYDFS